MPTNWGAVGTGAASGAATGAAAGSVVPGIGTAIGAGVGAIAGGLSSWLGSRGQNQQSEEERRARIAALELAHQRGEDTRIGNNALGASLLAGIGGSPAYHGNIQVPTFTPTAAMSTPRKYDFRSATADTTAGSGDALLSALFGSVRDVASQPGTRQPTTLTSSGVTMSPMAQPNVGPQLTGGTGGQGSITPEDAVALMSALGY